MKHGDAFHEHYGETRDDRLREFHEMNDTPVIGLWEAGLLRVEEGRVRLLRAPAGPSSARGAIRRTWDRGTHSTNCWRTDEEGRP